MTHVVSRILKALLPLALLVAVPALSQVPGPVIDPTAEAVLQQMSALFKSAQSLRYEAMGSVSMKTGTMAKDMSTKTTLAARRPNLLNLHVNRGSMAIDNIADGSALTSYVPAVNMYLRKSSPNNWGDIISRHLAIQAAVIDDSRFGFFYLMDDPYAAAIRGASVVQYLGQESVDGVACHKIRFARRPYNVDILFETGERPVPRRFIPDTASLAGNFAQKVPGLEIQIEYRLDGWELNPTLEDSLFQFNAPPDAGRSDSFSEMMRPKEPTSLIGKPAPTFSSNLVGGRTFNLADYKGKQVVVLDFWATWCGPCVMALPILVEVTNKYRDQGVVFVAVNVGDDEETIKKFLNNKQIAVSVAHDPEGKAANLYYVNGIPQTVLIGKDGNVADVHVGVGNNLKEEITAALEDLIAGRPVSSGAAVQPPR